MNRRGFFAALLAFPAALVARRKLKPLPRVLYMDTDSVVFHYPDGGTRPLFDEEMKLLFKYQLSTLYGKLGDPPSGGWRPSLLGVYVRRV